MNQSRRLAVCGVAAPQYTPAIHSRALARLSVSKGAGGRTPLVNEMLKAAPVAVRVALVEVFAARFDGMQWQPKEAQKTFETNAIQDPDNHQTRTSDKGTETRLESADSRGRAKRQRGDTERDRKRKADRTEREPAEQASEDSEERRAAKRQCLREVLMNEGMSYGGMTRVQNGVEWRQTEWEV